MSKRQVESLIKNAKTEDQLMKDITQLAVKSHGEQVVNKIIDEAVDESDLQEKITKLASTPYQSNIEKAGVTALSTLQPIAKAVSHVTTPIFESVRGPFQFIAQNVGENTSQTSPIDPLAEFEDPFGPPTNRGSMANLLTDISNSMGIKQYPLAKFDINGYPVTSEALTQLSNPAELTAALLEAMSGSKFAKIPGTNKMGVGARLGSVAEDVGSIPGVKKVGEIASEFYPSSLLDPLTKRMNRREMIKNYVIEAARDRGLLDDIMASGQFEYIVDMLESNQNLIKPFNQKSALDALEGPVLANLNPETNRMTYRRAPEQGQLGKLAAQQSSIIEEIPPLYNVNREDFLASALNELPDGLDSSQRTSAERLIRDSVGPISRDPQKLARVLEGDQGLRFDPTIPDEAAYNEFIYNLNQAEAAPFLNQQRKTGNVYIDQTSPFVDPRDVAARTQAGRALESAASEGLKLPMSELQNVSRELYSDTNRAISARRDYRDLLTGARSARDHLGKIIPQGDIERGVVAKALGLGDEYLVPSMFKASDYLRRQGSQYMNAAARVAPVSIQGYEFSRDPDQKRGANATEFLNTKSGVNLFQIPRTSEGALQNIDLVKAKIEREFGPEVAMQMDSIKDSAGFTNFMADLANMNPMAFTPDPYNRFDGVIKHPVLKTKALEDIVKNNKMNVLEKANSAEELMINSKFHEVQK